MNDKKKSASSSSEHAAELERIEHAKKIVIEVLDKGILGLREVGLLAIDLSRLMAVWPRTSCGDCNNSMQWLQCNMWWLPQDLPHRQ